MYFKGVFFICYFPVYLLASLNTTTFNDLRFFLETPLKKVFKTSNLTQQVLSKYFNRSSDLLDMLLEHKKNSIGKLSEAFAEGFFQSIDHFLQNYEIESTEAFLNNPKLRKNFTKYRKEFPRIDCSSGNLNIIEISSYFTEDNFNVLPIYYGIKSLVESIRDFQIIDIDKMRKGLKNITSSIKNMQFIIEKKMPKYSKDCFDFINQQLSSFIKIHEEENSLMKRIVELSSKKNISLIKNLTNIVDGMKFEYFDSLSPRPKAFSLIAKDYGVLLHELNSI